MTMGSADGRLTIFRDTWIQAIRHPIRFSEASINRTLTLHRDFAVEIPSLYQSRMETPASCLLLAPPPPISLDTSEDTISDTISIPTTSSINTSAPCSKASACRRRIRLLRLKQREQGHQARYSGSFLGRTPARNPGSMQ